MITTRSICSGLLSAFIISVNLITLPLDYFTIDRSLIITPFVFIFALFLFMFTLACSGKTRLMPKQMYAISICFLFTIIIPAIIGLTRNTAIEVVPSLLRYISYYFTFFIFYHFTSANVYSINKIQKVLKSITLLLLLFSIIQIASDKLIYMNGAYRLSSIYGDTPAGFALITLVLAIYFYCQMYVAVHSKYDFCTLLFFFCVTAVMMMMTQSRQSIVTLLILIGMFHFIRARSIYKLFTILLMSLLLYVFYWLIVNTDLFPRLSQMIFNYASDSSTHTRISIITDAYANLSVEDIIYGIGLGGFNKFYYGISGDLGVAAHNDFFLFFVEGGLISLLIYVAFVIGGMWFWIRVVKKFGEKYLTALCVFSAIYLFSFLNNPYYYPQVQVISAALMGVYIANYMMSSKKEKYVLQSA